MEETHLERAIFLFGYYKKFLGINKDFDSAILEQIECELLLAKSPLSL